MKVGILTFQNTTNYGALFQMYALSNTIHNFGVNYEVINYRCQAIENREMVQLKGLNIKNIIKHLILSPSNKQKHESFQKFAKENIFFTDDTYTIDNVKTIEDKFDRIIVGSDQVWNLDLTGGDTTYFLDFIKDDTKKYTYAASFGKIQLSSEKRELMKNYVTKFQSVYAREYEGKVLAEEFGCQEVELVLDPTFLVDNHNWRKIAKKNTFGVKGDYIFLYLILGKKQTFDYARKMAKKMNCEIVYINISPRTEAGMKNVRNATPEEFLYLLSNAKLVITGSYHGMALSLNMNVDFIYEMSKKVANYNSRIMTLNQIFDIKSRELDYEKFVYDPFDYHKVNQQIEALREKSLRLLEEALL